MGAYGPIDDPDLFLAESVRIVEGDLQSEFVRLPADLAYWNHKYSEAYKAWLVAKTATEQHEAAVSINIRTALEQRSRGGRVTLAEVQHEVLLDPGYRTCKAVEIAAEAEKVRLYGVVDAIRAKREMLVSLGAHLRAEMGNDPFLRRQSNVNYDVAQGRKER